MERSKYRSLLLHRAVLAKIHSRALADEEWRRLDLMLQRVAERTQVRRTSTTWSGGGASPLNVTRLR